MACLRRGDNETFFLHSNDFETLPHETALSHCGRLTESALHGISAGVGGKDNHARSLIPCTGEHERRDGQGSKSVLRRPEPIRRPSGRGGNIRRSSPSGARRGIGERSSTSDRNRARSSSQLLGICAATIPACSRQRIRLRPPMVTRLNRPAGSDPAAAGFPASAAAPGTAHRTVVVSHTTHGRSFGHWAMRGRCKARVRWAKFSALVHCAVGRVPTFGGVQRARLSSDLVNTNRGANPWVACSCRSKPFPVPGSQGLVAAQPDPRLGNPMTWLCAQSTQSPCLRVWTG